MEIDKMTPEELDEFEDEFEAEFEAEMAEFEMAKMQADHAKWEAEMEAKWKAEDIAAMVKMEAEMAEFEAEMAKIKAEMEADDAEFEAEMAKMKAEMEADDAEWEAKMDAERKKILNRKEDGLYNDITGKRIPYMNDEGDHIDYDHGWYD